ncbi:hypothetical protein IIC68_01745 [archaeon]|nr:hypothetical protein [archaeon]
MHKLIFAPLLLVALLGLSGCTAPTQGDPQCAQVITPAVGPDGTCTEYPTPCDVPVGHTLVDSCETEQEVTPPVEEPVVEPEPEVPFIEPPVIPQPEPEFIFDPELRFCEYNSLFKKYTFLYQIRNRTDNIPTYQAKIFMRADEIDYAQAKTIQNTYEKDRILWQDQRIDVVGTSYTGQLWDIRNVDTNIALDFQLIYCEPEFATKELCTAQNGIVIVEGNTADVCTNAGA